MRFFWLRLFSSGSRDEISTTTRKRHTLLAFVSKSRGQPKSGAHHRRLQHNCSFTGFGLRPARYLTQVHLCRLRHLALKDPVSTMISAERCEGGKKSQFACSPTSPCSCSKFYFAFLFKKNPGTRERCSSQKGRMRRGHTFGSESHA